MANFFFFTDPNKVTQADNQKFGPVDEGLYRVTSSFSPLNGNSKVPVYAAFNSYVAVFDHNDSSSAYVNLVLVPIVKAQNELQPSVEYMVYRGLKRNDFMSSDGSQLLSETEVNTDGTDLMKGLYSQVTDGTPTLAHLKYEKDVADNKFLFNFFFEKQEVITVQAGDLIGYFDSAGLGVDLLMGEYKFTPTTGYVKADLYEIEVDFYNYLSPGNESPLTLAKREKIHNFIDPAAYYSLHREIGVSYFENGIKKRAKHDDLHIKIISKFKNKNRTYIDIRNGNDYSLNYYNDNENLDNENLAFAVNASLSNPTSPTPSSYYTLYWPILILDDIQPLPNRNYINIYFEFFTTYNPNPSIYIDFAYSDQIEFSTVSTNHIQEFNLNIAGRKFSNTNYKTLYFPAIEASGECLCWFSRIYYLRNKLPQTATFPTRVVPTFNPFDNVMGFISKDGVGRYKYDYTSAANLNKTSWRLGLSKKYVPRGKGNRIARMVQTGIGISKDEVCFFAVDLDRDQWYSDFNLRADKSKNLDSINSGIGPYDEFKKALTRTYNLQYIKNEFTDGNVSLSLDQGETPNSKSFPNNKFFYSILLTREEVSVIQQLVDTHFDTSIHTVNFGWDLFKKTQDNNDHYYGSARLNLFGMDSNGNFKQINALRGDGTPPAPLNQNLFLNSYDALSYCTVDSINKSDEDLKIEKRNNERAVLSTEEYINLIKEVEEAFPPPSTYTTPESQKKYISETINRVRRYYYGSESTKHSFFERPLLNHALTDSRDASLYKTRLVGDGNVVREEKYLGIEQSTFDQLTDHADENTIKDNPSPYIKVKNPLSCPNINNLSSCNDFQLIDIGHLLYGLEALLVNRDSTGFFFNYFQLYRSNDFAGYIADVFTAAAESRVYKNGNQDYFDGKFFYPETNDLDRLYEISAPEADLLSDIDPFGVYNVYQYFIESMNPTPSSEPKTLSFLLEYFYNENYDPIQHPSLFPVEANFKKRWLNFCLAYDTVTTNDPNDLPEFYFDQYQGFVEYDSVSNQYKWEADDPAHGSVRTLRRRGEVFSHFWYQMLYIKNNKTSTIINAINPWAPPVKLETGTQDKPIRFERDFSTPGTESNQTIQGWLSHQINEYTDPSELEYVMNKFLQWVKTNFLLEKSLWNY